MLRHSDRKRDLAQMQRATSLARVIFLQEQLASLKETRAHSADSLSLASRWHAQELQQAKFRCDWMTQQCARMERQLQVASLELQEKDRVLRLAQRECKKFELLRARRRSAWSLWQERLAQKQTDEIASQFHARGSSCPEDRQN